MTAAPLARCTPHSPRLLGSLLMAGVLAGLAASVAPIHAQQNDDAVIRRCESELEFRIGRDMGGRRPDVGVDYRRARIRQESGSTMSVRGTGIYRRDNGDRGRPYTFDCTVSTRNGDVRVNYSWNDFSDNDRPGFGNGGGRGNNGGGNPPPVEQTFFTGAILNVNSGKCLDVEGRSLRDGAPVQQWSCSSGGNQQWDLIERGRNTYAIISKGSGKALEVADNANADGGLVQQNRDTRRNHQLWRLERSSGNVYRIVAVGSGKCLDVFDASRADGAKVQQWSCSNGQNQAWVLRR